jgi:cysteine synthase
MLYNNLFNLVGNTPIVRFKYDQINNRELFIKLEGYNPTGSVKDRPALSIINSKLNSGELSSGKIILDASSGSYACSIAMFGYILGYKVKVITGSKITKSKIEFLKYFKAENINFGEFTIEGNKYCKDILVKKNPDKYCFLDQLHNWENPKVHYETTGPEIFKDLPSVKAVAFSLGSGGTLNGISRYIKENKLDVKIIAVTANSGTKIPGTGAFIDGDYKTPFIKEAFKKGWFDYIPEVSFEQAYKKTEELNKFGFYVGIQTGAVYQGLIDAINKLDISGKLLIISGDSAWKG